VDRYLSNGCSIWDAGALDGKRPATAGLGPEGRQKRGHPFGWGILVLKLDALLMRADINRLEAERPDLDHAIVQGLYDHFVDCHERQPELGEFRGYVDHITSSIEWLDLHKRFSTHEPTLEERQALTGPPSPVLSKSAGRRGRPKGSRLTSRNQLIATYGSLRKRYGRPPSQSELASNLEPPIAKRTLQQHLREYSLPWPPE
jgi:hypothetical protein